MTRYDEIARRAVEQARQFHASRERCERFAAFPLMKALAQHLGCPAQAISYVKLRPDLRGFGERIRPVAWGVPDLIPSGDGDGYWYFAIRIDFVTADEGPLYTNSITCRFGVKESGEGFLFCQEKDTYVDPRDPASIAAFCEAFCELLRKDFAAPGSSVRQIGFRQYETSPPS